MAELHIYRGIQGSGKSTMAKHLAFLDGGRVVGRDHVRRLMGFEGLGNRKQEDEVTQIQVRLIHGGLRSGQNVHVDDMNLKAIYVKRLMGIAAYFDAEIVFHDLTDTPLDICLERNRQRAKGQGHVNEEVIWKTFFRFVAPTNGKGLPIPEAPVFDTKYLPFEPYQAPEGVSRDAVLIDVDGTLALHGTPENPESIRKHHDYGKVHLDVPNPAVVKAVRALIFDGYHPIVVSSRPDSCKDATRLWIQKHVTVAPFDLIMRRTGDHRPDYLVKYELFNEHIRDKYNVVAALDDRDQVVNMYREIGITVFQVAPGNF